MNVGGKIFNYALYNYCNTLTNSTGNEQCLVWKKSFENAASCSYCKNINKLIIYENIGDHTPTTVKNRHSRNKCKSILNLWSPWCEHESYNYWWHIIYWLITLKKIGNYHKSKYLLALAIDLWPTFILVELQENTSWNSNNTLNETVMGGSSENARWRCLCIHQLSHYHKVVKLIVIIVSPRRKFFLEEWSFPRPSWGWNLKRHHFTFTVRWRTKTDLAIDGVWAY